MSYLLSFLFLFWAAIISVVFFPIAVVIRIISAPFDRRLVLLNFFSHFWGACYFWSMPFWSIKVTGRENFKPNTTYVIVSNHLSTMDVLAVSMLFVPFKWVSKVENFKIPFVGWTMYLNKYVAIKRGGLSSIKLMMRQSKAHLANGSSIFIFPEGSRSADGQLKPFKTGAFKLAKEMNVAVMPVVLRGTAQAMPKHSLHFKGRHKIEIEVLAPIESELLQQLSLQQAASLAHEKILQAQ
ncbi:MAG: 1-acyl-sn-glycerol-3-phosphate acyltransferase [Gammaproteobacteria bacterium]|nr:1-acyl-sn-glycerol-3-phosphate acyltransferase [Gammaproteobacteria bacterium]